MSDQLEQLIKEIAVKHGIAVARDDPILVLQTINYRLLEDSAAAQQEQLEKFKEEMEGVSQRWQNDARDKAERIVNASLAASAQAMETVMADGARKAAEAVQWEVAMSVDTLHAVGEKVTRTVLAAIVIGCCIAAAALL